MTRDQKALEQQASPVEEPAAAKEVAEAVPGDQDLARRRSQGAMPWGRHPVDIRLSIPLLAGRYYVTLVAGKERRNAERRSNEKRKHPLITLGNLAVFFGFGLLSGLAAMALVQLAGSYLFIRSGIMVLSQ